MISFSSVLFLSSNFLCSFNLGVLCLVGPGVGAGSGPVAGLGSGASSGTGTGSGASLAGGILSRSLIVNILLLRLLRIFSLASKNNHRLLKKDLFFNWFYTFIYIL